MDTSRPINGWVAAHLQKRALSSPAAIQASLKNRLNAVKKAATADAKRGSRAEAEAKAAVADLFESEDASDEEQSHRLDVSSTSMSLDQEVGYLTNLQTLAKKITAAKDPKLAHLVELVPRRIEAHADAPRVMVFTKYTDTLKYLEKSLSNPIAAHKDKLPADLEVFSIDGSLSLAERRRVFRAFERATPAVLIATDCISEGLNLQHACAEIIHYELPWNPNRLEQRNGRVDRFGQREPFVGINTLVLDDDLDATLLELIVKKSDEMRAEYGFVPPFLANTDILSLPLRRCCTAPHCPHAVRGSRTPNGARRSSKTPTSPTMTCSTTTRPRPSRTTRSMAMPTSTSPPSKKRSTGLVPRPAVPTPSADSSPPHSWPSRRSISTPTLMARSPSRAPTTA